MPKHFKKPAEKYETAYKILDELHSIYTMDSVIYTKVHRALQKMSHDELFGLYAMVLTSRLRVKQTHILNVASE